MEDGWLVGANPYTGLIWNPRDDNYTTLDVELKIYLCFSPHLSLSISPDLEATTSFVCSFETSDNRAGSVGRVIRI